MRGRKWARRVDRVVEWERTGGKRGRGREWARTDREVGVGEE